MSSNSLDAFGDEADDFIKKKIRKKEPVSALSLDEERMFSLRERELKIQTGENSLLERKKFGTRVFNLVCWWLGAMIFLVLLDGLGGIPYTNVTFDISEGTMITLITTTTINILGLLTIVVLNVFPKSST